jgi:hypothetical protein
MYVPHVRSILRVCSFKASSIIGDETLKAVGRIFSFETGAKISAENYLGRLISAAKRLLNDPE